MKILIYGAGVLGCNLARNFFRAGKGVTLLARGSWAEEIKKNGLRINDKFSPFVSVTKVPVVTELKPEDDYDVIFVVMRCSQVWAVTETLRASIVKNIVLSETTFAPRRLPRSCRRRTSCSRFRSPPGTASATGWCRSI